MQSLTRRHVLKQGSLAVASVAAASLLPGICHASDRELAGLQLYSVGDLLRQDPAGTLEAVAKIGYRYVETAGFAGLSAAQFRDRLHAAGLHCPSCHLPLSTGNLNQLFADARTVGAHYAISSTLLPPEAPGSSGLPVTAEQFEKIAANANRIGGLAKQQGLQYAYHNHAFEFVKVAAGKTGYDILLEHTDPELVTFELDCGWMVFAGYDPLQYLRKFPARYDLIHVKDFLAAKPASGRKVEMQNTELGRGVIDYRPILQAAHQAGVSLAFVEQEPPFLEMQPLQAVRVDYQYLERALRAAGER